MAVKLLNDVRSKLSVAVSATDSVIRVLAGHDARFPVIETSTDWFPVALEDENGNIEYLKCTARNGDQLTVERGVEGSVARAYPSGSLCELRMTVASLTEFIEQIVTSQGGTVSNLAVVNVADGTVGS